jgi:DNA repair ATPase RecN
VINSILIHNFQSHKKASIDLSKGINILIGSSDSGKSAFIRAINWLANNRPSGESFRSNWGGDTSVAVELDNDSITRIRSSKLNRYEIIWDIEAAKMGEVSSDNYDAIKTDIPEDVSKLLNFEDLNIQSQMDKPFLLGETSGEVARYLNQIVNLEVIDTSLAAIEKQRRASLSDITYKEETLKEQQEKLKEFDYLDALEKELSALDKTQNKFAKEKDSYTFVSELIDKIEALQTEIDALEYDKNALFEIDKLLDITEKITKEENEKEILEDKVHEIEKSRYLLSLNIFDAEAIIQIDNLLGTNEKLEKEIEKRNKITGLLASYKCQNKDICDTIVHLGMLYDQEKELTPDICPLCGAEMK